MTQEVVLTKAALSPIGSAPTYTSARTLGVWVSFLLGLCIAVALVQIFVVDPYFQGWLAIGSESIVYTVEVAGLFSLAVTAPLFLVWFRRAYRNAAVLGAANLQFSPGWAVGWWLVPIASFWMPLLAALDLWKASDPVVSEGGQSRRPDGAPVLVAVWWAAWLLFMVMANVTAVLDNPDDTSLILSTGSNAATILAAVLAIVVVMTVSGRQDRRWRQLSQSAPSPVVRIENAPPE